MFLRRKPTLLESVAPVVFLVSFLTLNVFLLGTDSINGANQMAMIMATAFCAVITVRLGYGWSQIEHSMIKSISHSMGAILILLVIGALSGAWLFSGIVPCMIYYGLKILHPSYFLFATTAICCIVSVATGSSWSTVATIGVALLGVGKTLDINEAVVAGAIISGAYFGDKMSPLSDTTNLAAAVSGAELFSSIRYVAITTVPSICLTLLIFFIWGFTLTPTEAVDQQTASVLMAIEESFNITPVLFIAPLLVCFLIIKKMPAFPALLIGSILGCLFAIIFQPEVVRHFSPQAANYAVASFSSSLLAMTSGLQIDTSHPLLYDLLSSGGMAGMLNTVWLILCAMMFGGAMETSGMFEIIVNRIIVWAHSTGSLVATTVTTCIFFNLTTSDQYISIAIPGRMFSEIYSKRGYRPELLSRSIEDSGTVTSVLVPWNTCGATQSKVLGVATMSYAPFCFFCIISPMMSILQAYLNYKIVRGHALKKTTS